MIWGIGPSFNLPTATATPLGSAKFSMGPAAVALVMPKPWVIGTLARQLWSVAGPSNRPNVSQFLLQPFVNYNMEEGWYLVSSPIITANWEASSGNKWAFPIGAGIGKIFRIGEQPMNASLQAFDYLHVADWRTAMGRSRPTAVSFSAIISCCIIRRPSVTPISDIWPARLGSALICRFVRREVPRAGFA